MTHDRPASPDFEARLLTAPEERERVAHDFGGVHHHVPAAVVRPRSVEDVVEAVAYARRHGMKIAARGVGHSAGGQAQVEGGLVIDMTSLDRVHEVDAEAGYIVADAGVRWQILMDTLAPLGLTPTVVTDWLHLTLGGTIIAGGVGAQSFRHGIQADLVEALTVVTGDGQVITCSPTEHADLFDACRAGLGQYGVIVQARVRVVRAPRRVTLDHLVYDDLDAFLADVERLMASDAVDGLLAHGVGNMLELIGRSTGVDLTSGGVTLSSARWAYDLEVFRHHRDDDDLPGPLPAGLQHIAALSHRRVWRFADVVARIPPIVERDRREGAAPHPELAMFVPGSRAAAFLGDLMAETAVEDMGGGPVLLIPMTPGLIRAPLFRVPDEARCWLVGMMRAAADPDAVRRLGDLNADLLRRATALGALRYPCDGATTDADGWRAHYGPVWEQALAAKARYDPDGLFAPALGIFPTPPTRPG